jgi:hypothetical protein|nr:hypothetical protein [uncultured Cohaesibacter sp.]
MAVGDLSNAVLHRLSDGQCHTIDHLDYALPDFKRREIVKCAGRLVMRGLLERVELGCYQLTDDGKQIIASGQKITSGPIRADRGLSRKPRETLRQRAWNAMRMSGAFTIGDIVMAASTGSEKNADNNLQRYFCALVKARYLTVLPVRVRGTKLTSNGFKRFRLMKDTGPIAPIYRANKGCLFDHNLGERGEIIPCQ